MDGSWIKEMAGCCITNQKDKSRIEGKKGVEGETSNIYVNKLFVIVCYS